MSSLSVLETLSKGQLEAPMSLVSVVTQRVAEQSSNDASEASSSVDTAIAHYSNAEMLIKKNKNCKATPAQTYFLVSVVM